MARILYGVCGEGMGHAIRSAVIIRHLLKNNEVLIVTNDRAFHYLSKRFPNVHYIAGYNIVYEDNMVKNLKTFVRAMKAVPGDMRRNIKLLYRIVKKFNPTEIITDFEPFVNIISHIMKIPIISIGNHHIITKTKIKISPKYFFERLMVIFVNRLYVVRPKKYLITTFFYPPIKNKKRTLLFPPVLREKIMNLKPKEGKHILVYQTSDSCKKLIPTLKKIPTEKFIVYGLHKEKKDGNVELKNFNEENFMNELASAKAVITNGGFTLISEALHLGKPVLSVPVRKQFEQILNAIHLKRLKYGESQEQLSSEVINDFLGKIDSYKENLKNYKSSDNSRLLKEIDCLIKKHEKKVISINFRNILTK